MSVDTDGLTMRLQPEAVPGEIPAEEEAPDHTGAPRIYTIWPATEEDLPAATCGPWNQERHWLVLDVTDGIAASYIVEGPVTHPEAIHRVTEIQIVAWTKRKDSNE